jgi:hypothetical protein
LDKREAPQTQTNLQASFTDRQTDSEVYPSIANREREKALSPPRLSINSRRRWGMIISSFLPSFREGL